MVRFSLVNLYLHGFADPHIHDYDTLTSDDRWNEFYDVILANPPFMSPKGGIRPHNRFSVKSSRSEVLFVDYIAEHLTPNGRAGIIVPEGIIFQSGKAYKQLRKMLVDNFLVAVISLPMGVFNPYSGVKTSILILDKSLAKQSNSVGFFTIENDGFDRGATRRPIDKNDLPQVKKDIRTYLNLCKNKAQTDVTPPANGLIVDKQAIIANKEHNFSESHYRETDSVMTEWEMTNLEDVVIEMKDGGTPPRKHPEYFGGDINWAVVKDIKPEIWTTKETLTAEGLKNSSAKVWPVDSIIISLGASIGHVGIAKRPTATKQGLCGIVVNREKVLPMFLACVLRNKTDFIRSLSSGVTIKEVRPSKLKTLFSFPLPPLEIQQEIVSEVDGYQKIIDGARMVINNYHPHIPTDHNWPMVELKEFATLINGRAYKRDELLSDGPTPVLRVGNFFSNKEWYYSDLDLPDDKYCAAGDLLYAWSASFGPRIWDGPRAIFHYHIWKIKISDEMDKKFLYFLLENDSKQIKAEGHGIAMIHATKSGMEKRKFPLPPIRTQQAIVSELEAEQSLVNANHELIKRMEQKIDSTIARVWGE